MTKKLQIIFSYLLHIVLICLGFFLLHERVDAFLVTAGIIYGAYLLFYIIVNRKTYIPWVLLLHHLIGSAIQFLLHFFEIIPPDSGLLSGLGQLIYLFALPAYWALLLLVHAILYLVYKVRTKHIS